MTFHGTKVLASQSLPGNSPACLFRRLPMRLYSVRIRKSHSQTPEKAIYPK